MSCNHPIYAIDLGLKENGKRNLKIVPNRPDLSSMKQLQARFGSKSIIPLPCGKCLACKLSRAREWSVRCTLEASLYEDNCFITLTYDDKHLPKDGKLCRKHLTDFLKRLRSSVNIMDGSSIRYFACGEYGSTTKRPHYHLIVFGFFPKDLKNGSSQKLSELWPFGFNYVGECTFESCNYVARYTTKKIFKDEKTDEFITMSTHPGIGYGWLEKHFDIFDDGAIFGRFGSGKVSNIPRYFEKVFELIDPKKLKELKDDRIDNASSLKLNELISHCMQEVEFLYEYKDSQQIADYKRRGDRKDL